MKLKFYFLYSECLKKKVHYAGSINNCEDEKIISDFLTGYYRKDELERDISRLENNSQDPKWKNLISTESWFGDIKGDIVEVYFAFDDFDFKDVYINREELAFIFKSWLSFIKTIDVNSGREFIIDSMNRTVEEDFDNANVFLF